MISEAAAGIEPGGVLRTLRSGPPLTVRRIAHEDRGICALCLVGSAAGPLAGDEVSFDLTVSDRARAELTWTGASLAQGRLTVGRPASLRTTARIGDQAVLQAETAPVVVCAGSSVDITVGLELSPTATVTWRETVVLGRHDEPAGAVTTTWRIDRAGAPVLRQRVELLEDWRRDWPGTLAGAKVLTTAFVTGPAFRPETYVESATAVCQQLDSVSALLTVLDDDYAGATKRMDGLLERFAG